MAQPEFSERGDKPTKHERELLAQLDGDDPRHIRQLWILIAQRIGIDALCVVLDELGGTTSVSVPTRRTFFRELGRQKRDAEIRRLRGRVSTAQIALTLGVHPSTVRRGARRTRSNWVTRADRA